MWFPKTPEGVSARDRLASSVGFTQIWSRDYTKVDLCVCNQRHLHSIVSPLKVELDVQALKLGDKQGERLKMHKFSGSEDEFHDGLLVFCGCPRWKDCGFPRHPRVFRPGTAWPLQLGALRGKLELSPEESLLISGGSACKPRGPLWFRLPSAWPSRPELSFRTLCSA